jgi:hypothetical protein
MEGIRSLGRHAMFWLPMLVIVLLVARKPVTYLYGQFEETSPDSIRQLITSLDDPFTPILWTLDIKQPETAPECTTDMASWLYGFVTAGQLAGTFSMLVVVCSLIVVAIAGPVSWWQYVHDRDDVIVNDLPAWKDWPIQIKTALIAGWSYFLIAAALSRWVA